MNAKNTYENGIVTFGHLGGGKWQFEVTGSGVFSLVSEAPGGLKTATQISDVILSSVKRTKTYVDPLDGLARYEIGQIVNPPAVDED
jgi:hypothetical protein